MKSEFNGMIDSNNKDVCNLEYLSKLMGGKKHLIKEIIDVFLQQIPEELQFMEDGIKKEDYKIIKKFAHTMKSSVSVMCITSLTPILQEMEDLGTRAVDIDKIKNLNLKLNLICKQALKEIEKAKLKYV